MREKDKQKLIDAIGILSNITDPCGYQKAYARSAVKLLNDVLERREAPLFLDLVPRRSVDGAVEQHVLNVLGFDEDKISIWANHSGSYTVYSRSAVIDRDRARFLAEVFTSIADGKFNEFRESFL